MRKKEVLLALIVGGILALVVVGVLSQMNDDNHGVFHDTNIDEFQQQHQDSGPSSGPTDPAP